MADNKGPVLAIFIGTIILVLAALFSDSLLVVDEASTSKTIYPSNIMTVKHISG